LDSSGTARSGQNATISWQTSGKVGEVNLKPGDTVQEGQVLAALDPLTLSNDVINARLDLINAQDAMDDLAISKLKQAQAQQAVEDAQKTLNSLTQTAITDSSQAQLTLAQAQDAYDAAVLNRGKMNYPHTTDKLVVEKALTDYKLAKEAYKKALQTYNRVDYKRMTSPVRVRALNDLLAAQQAMDKAYATYNWYLLNYSNSDIAEADGELAVAQANLEKAQSDYDLLKNGSSPASVAVAEAQLADAQREWERLKDGPTQEDIDAAQASIDAAQAVLDRAQLKAPFAGTITEVDIKTGDLVNSGTSAFRIDDLASINIDLQISEVDLANLKSGQKAIVEFDAIPDKQYSGEVTEIGMIGNVTQGVVNYPVTVRITDADDSIRPGMTASVSVILAEHANVLYVPNKAIRTSAGQQTVTVLFEGQQISVPVTVGLINDTFSEVSSDQLREGDTLVLSGTTASNPSNQDRGGVIQFEAGPGGPPGGVIIGP
jgi:HlyD family secretion protein